MPVAGQQSIPRRLRRDGRDDARARLVDVASRLAAVAALGSGADAGQQAHHVCRLGAGTRLSLQRRLLPGFRTEVRVAVTHLLQQRAGPASSTFPLKRRVAISTVAVLVLGPSCLLDKEQAVSWRQIC